MCFLIPIEWNQTDKSPGYNGTPLKEAPMEKDIVESCHFWILGGQHTIMAYKAILDEGDKRCTFREELKLVTGLMFWSPYNLKANVTMMGLSRALNNIQQTRLNESNFPLVASQA